MPASASLLSALLPASQTALGPLSAGDSIRLVQALATIPDPRRRRGRRHGLQSVLLLALQAVMAGASSWVAIAQWAASAPQALGVCGPAPSAATFRRVPAAVDITLVEAALTVWVTGGQARARAQRPARTPAAERRTVLAVDGKTLRGSRDADGQRAKLVCVFDHAHRLVLTQAAVVAGDEIAAFTAALATLPSLTDVLVTADALHCQRGPHQAFGRAQRTLFVHGQEQPAAAAPGAATAAVGPGARQPGVADEATAAPSLARSR